MELEKAWRESCEESDVLVPYHWNIRHGMEKGR